MKQPYTSNKKAIQTNPTLLFLTTTEFDILWPLRSSKKIKCNTKRFYYAFLNNYLYICYILVVRHPDDGQRSNRNMLVKDNNMWLNTFINVQLLVYHISIKHSLVHRHGTHKLNNLFFHVYEIILILHKVSENKILNHVNHLV